MWAPWSQALALPPRLRPKKLSEASKQPFSEVGSGQDDKDRTRLPPAEDALKGEPDPMTCPKCNEKSNAVGHVMHHPACPDHPLTRAVEALTEQISSDLGVIGDYFTHWSMVPPSSEK